MFSIETGTINLQGSQKQHESNKYSPHRNRMKPIPKSCIYARHHSLIPKLRIVRTLCLSREQNVAWNSSLLSLIRDGRGVVKIFRYYTLKIYEVRPPPPTHSMNFDCDMKVFCKFLFWKCYYFFCFYFFFY